MNFFKSIFIILVFLTSVSESFSQSKVFANEQNIAINGYDAVAYFNQHEAVRGNNEHAVKKNGATYYFSAAENAKTFKTNPNAYQPQYGGYCAFAMGMKGARVPSDPTTFKIRDGKLYFFFNDYYEGKPFNTIIPWNGSETQMLSKANTNWKNLKK